ncbi:heme-binding protein [Caldisphaera sp.]|uniref:GlcG/HbpS family heme-binding protein n=1 Tax=Caldisphaera sp. TaxID=2060322 RepID=UPI003D147606
MSLNNTLNLNLARKIINAMISFSMDNNMLPGSYAVTDSGGHVVALERRDSALPATVDLAIDKAWTASVMKLSAKVLDQVITRGEGWRLNVKYHGRMTLIHGAIPLIIQGEVVGGIGHSGESIEGDEKIAQAGFAGAYREEEFKTNVEKGLEISRSIAESVINYVNSNKLKPVAITVTDVNGWPLLIYRMDGTPYGFVEISRSRAWTSSAFKSNSHEATKIVGEIIECPNGEDSNERFNTSQGGIYIGNIIGSLGVAGNSPEEDYKIATNSLKSLNI